MTALPPPMASGNSAPRAACSHFVYVTVSTGIGGGVVVDGRLLHGRRGMAGHVGHMIIDAGRAALLVRRARLLRGAGVGQRARRVRAGRR